MFRWVVIVIHIMIIQWRIYISNIPLNPNTNDLCKQWYTNRKTGCFFTFLSLIQSLSKSYANPARGKYHLNKLVFMQALPSYNISVYAFYLNKIISSWIDSCSLSRERNPTHIHFHILSTKSLLFLLQRCGHLIFS